ncbi:MAG: hypothetical protein ACI835_005644 [Planctomycetota bacterium]|jgi:hypothetical protein
MELLKAVQAPNNWGLNCGGERELCETRQRGDGF